MINYINSKLDCLNNWANRYWDLKEKQGDDLGGSDNYFYLELVTIFVNLLNSKTNSTGPR
jgi:hypothetical protein